ncbi:MAG TPA: hypothetical protein ENN67_02495 [Firmicutes bacterium]|nr:hypothetical protein [Bacillota bacterium]
MNPEITMRELIILVLCFVLYVVAVEVFEAKIETSRRGQLVKQEHSFVYVPPAPPVNDDGTTISIESEQR